MKILKQMEQVEAELGRIWMEKAMHPDTEPDARAEVLMRIYKRLAALPETITEINRETERQIDKMSDVFGHAWFAEDGTMDDESERKADQIQDKIDILLARKKFMEVM